MPLIRETSEPVLLERRAAEMHKSTGNITLRARPDNKDLTSGQRLARAIIRPIKILLSPIVPLFSVYAALMFGLVYVPLPSFPAVLEE